MRGSVAGAEVDTAVTSEKRLQQQACWMAGSFVNVRSSDLHRLHGAAMMHNLGLASCVI